jgi:hypothetical protein
MSGDCYGYCQLGVGTSARMICQRYWRPSIISGEDYWTLYSALLGALSTGLGEGRLLVKYTVYIGDAWPSQILQQDQYDRAEFCTILGNEAELELYKSLSTAARVSTTSLYPLFNLLYHVSYQHLYFGVRAHRVGCFTMADGDRN